MGTPVPTTLPARMGKITLLCCLLLCGAVTAQDNEEPRLINVHTFLGAIQGLKVETQSGTPFYKFLGIPYAQAPIGELRFKPPQPVTSWETHDATKEGPVCPQIDPFGGAGFTGAEDCLHLNIYTPSILASNNQVALKPVMVWIHGGGFVSGRGSEQHYGPSLLVEKDVVVVSINYRLGPLGFMTFGNDIVGGNMGLKDQTMALKWIQNHIRYFGGDPSKVTIFGESAGGMSVHAHVLSPLSKGLMSGAISQSGTMLYKMFETMGPREERNAVETAHFFECSSIDLDDDMLKCLQEVPIETLIEKTTSHYVPTFEEESTKLDLSWEPVVDNYCSEPFMPTQPLEALKTGMYNKIPFMSGTTKDEGALYAISILKEPGESAKNWNTTGPLLLGISKSSNWTEIEEEDIVMADIINQYYTGGEFSEDSKQGTIDMFTDSLFLFSDQKTVSLMSSGSKPVYNYQLTYRGSVSAAVLFGADVGEDYGVVHADDIQYLFTSDFTSFGEKTDDDRRMREIMVTYWTNFARYGNPSPFKKTGIPAWTPVKQGKMNYMDLSPSPEMKEELAAERMMFWQRMIWADRERNINKRMLTEKIANLQREKIYWNL